MRTKYGIGAIVLIVLLVWNSLSSTYADPASTAESGEPRPLTDAQTESSRASRSSTPGESDREEKPAEPFVPSESVSADSAVSFPVDI